MDYTEGRDDSITPWDDVSEDPIASLRSLVRVVSKLLEYISKLTFSYRFAHLHFAGSILPISSKYPKEKNFSCGMLTFDGPQHFL